MKLLRTLRDSDIGSNALIPVSYPERSASRGVVIDTQGKVALLNVTKKGYHKLPGGGLELGEDAETAFRREVLEEIGCEVTNIRELGMMEEYRNKIALHHLSYCFTADVEGEKGQPSFVGDEITDGFEPEWCDLKTAIEALESEKDVEDYEGKFIRLRDLTILKEAQKNA